VVTFLVFSDATSYRSVVLWHGMGDTCCNPLSMGMIKRWIEKEFVGIYVYSIEIGNSTIADSYNSYFMNVNDQIVEAHQKISAIPELSQGFNAIGFSQGGQFLRGYIERFNDPPVYNLISMGGQHQGVFGFPNCPGPNSTFCEEMRRMLRLGAYEPEIQDNLAQAEYWKDPYHLPEYLNSSVFLADINNERNEKNNTYKENLMTLANFVMVMFEYDTMVEPKESEWFQFYSPDEDNTTIPLQQSAIYTEDWIGLKELDTNGQLAFLSCPGNHLQFTETWFSSNIFPYLSNSYETPKVHRGSVIAAN
jgi:palmitoyl-protein thioesterase